MPWVLWGGAICFTMGSLVILLGLAIFRSDPRQRLNRVAALMLACGGLGVLQVALRLNAIAHGHGNTAATLLTASTLRLGWQFFFPSLLLFVLIFPQEVPWYRRIPFLSVLIFLPYAFHVGLTALADASGGTFFLERVPQRLVWAGSLRRTSLLGLSFLFDAHVWLFSLVNLNYILTTLVALAIRSRRTRSPRLQAQLATISIGLMPCIALYALADPVPKLFGATRYLPLEADLIMEALALLVGSGAIAYAIVRHKFLDAGMIIRRSIVFLVPALVLVLTYLSINGLLLRLFSGLHDFDSRLIEPLLLLLLLPLLQPLVARMEEIVDGYLRRDRREGRVVLQDLSRDIVTILDVELLAGRLTQSISESLLVERCALYIAEGGAFSVLASYDHETREITAIGSELHTRLGLTGSLLHPGALGEAPRTLDELADPNNGAWPDDVAAESFRRVAQTAGWNLFLPVTHGKEPLGVIAVGRKLTRGRFNREDLSLLSTLANQTGAALKNSSLYAESLRSAALEEELHVARQIQFKYLPSRFPKRTNLDVHGLNQPSREVGGDYFDVVELENEYIAAIADVAGKGVPAALVMSTVQACLRTQAGEGRGVAEMLSRINTLMLQSGVEGRFATCFLARIQLDDLQISYSNAGHNPPLLLRADGRVEQLSEGGLPIGAFDDPMLREGSTQLLPGDILTLYTDGVTEAANEDGELFGEERVIAALRALPPNATAQAASEHLRDEVRRFCTTPDLGDDMTILVFRAPMRAGVRTHVETPDAVEAGRV